MADVMPGSPAAPKKKKTGLIIGIIVAIIFIVAIPLIIFFAAIFGETADQAQMGKDFVTALSEEEYEVAYDMTSAEFQEATSLAEMKTFVENTPILANSTAVEFSYRGIENNLRIVSGTVYSGLESLPLTVHYVKNNGEWKILLFSVDPEDVPSMDGNLMEEDEL